MENKNGSLDASCMPCKFYVSGCTCIKEFDDIFQCFLTIFVVDTVTKQNKNRETLVAHFGRICFHAGRM